MIYKCTPIMHAVLICIAVLLVACNVDSTRIPGEKHDVIHDLGSIDANTSMDTVRTTLYIINDSDADKRIDNVKYGCVCTKGTLPDSTVPANGKVALPIAIAVRRWDTSLTKDISIVYKDGTMERHQVTARIARSISLEPRNAMLAGYGRLKESRTMTCELKNNTSKSIPVDSITSSLDNVHIVKFPSSLDPGVSNTIQLTYKIVDKEPQFGKLTVYTSSEAVVYEIVLQKNDE